MKPAAAIDELAFCQARLLNLVDNPAADFSRQYHPDLSPLGWHLGHCVYTESYWVREVVMRMEVIDAELKRLYIPELSVKTRRGGALPEFAELRSQARLTQEQNREYLLDLCRRASSHELLDKLFLVHFLIQHYAQHTETCLYVLHQRELQKKPVNSAIEPLQAQPLNLDLAALGAGEYPIGSNGNETVYDNERPGFTCALDAFHISKRPVTNGQYLQFMREDGYQNPDFWDARGWQWRRETVSSRPHHWRRDDAGFWYGVGLHGACSLPADAALSGINYFEANAFAAWARARLPHEYEWETANKQGVLQQTGECWEWCGNEFHPYEGFQPHPYTGYSVPYFDNRHYTLRGGSHHTQPCIKRPTFRNYYQPDKRHISAGLRLVAI